MKKIKFYSIVTVVLLLFAQVASGQSSNLDKSLEGFDSYIEQIMKDWNSPGIAVGIVVKGELAYAKGFGYRDLENKLPVTSKTLFPIASNTKLFTAVAMGMLVEEGKMTWDKPISTYVPQINFYNQELYNRVTLRDMLAHRTGISRHDNIWYKSDFSRKELFDRLVYLEPSQPMRQSPLYNNLMYAASGYCLELLSGQTWEAFTQERIFNPLGMTSSLFTIEDMEKQDDFAFPYYEEKETDRLTKRPFYRKQQGVGPAGAILSNLEDMSKWMAAIMNQGSYGGKEVISPKILKETLQPAIAYSNSSLESDGYDEVINSIYGMGRVFASYKGKYLTKHGGAIGGFYSQVSMMPYDSVGVLVFVNGSHNRPVIDIISYNIYDRILELDQTDFNGRSLKRRIEGKQTVSEGEALVGSDRVAKTKPSHPLKSFVGKYEDPAYGIVTIGLEGKQLQYDFHNVKQPLVHYHYDRFDTPDDPLNGKQSVNFSINPQGDVYTLTMSIDQYEVAFTKLPDANLTDPKILEQYVGNFEAAGTKVQMTLEEGQLYTKWPGQPKILLVPYKTNSFKYENYSDWVIEFVSDNGSFNTFKDIGPNGVFIYTKK